MNYRKNLLIITEKYPYKDNISGIFIKERVDFLKKEFKNIYVISPLSYFPKWAIKSSYIQNYSGFSKKPMNYSYDNVKVFYPKYFPIPTTYDFFLRMRLNLGFKVVYNTINQEKIKFDYIHSHFLGHAGYIGRKLKNIYNKPLVITAHGGDVYNLPFKNKKWLSIISKNVKSANKIITVSRVNQRILIEKLKVDQDKIIVIPNGFNKKKFKPLKKQNVRESLNLPKSKKIILTIGNLNEVKGHKYLIEAMEQIVKIKKDVICLIIGYGSKKNLNELIKEFKLEKFVKLLGGKNHDEIPLWINSCDIFILPSLSEGNPTVLTEALGCGKPVIATSVGGIPEVIKNREVGIIVEPKNSKFLAEKILYAIDKTWKTEKIVEYAQNNYSWDKLSNNIIKVYNHL